MNRSVTGCCMRLSHAVNTRGIKMTEWHTAKRQAKYSAATINCLVNTLLCVCVRQRLGWHVCFVSQGSCSVHCVDALIYVLVRGLTVCMYLYMHMDSVCVLAGLVFALSSSLEVVSDFGWQHACRWFSWASWSPVNFAGFQDRTGAPSEYALAAGWEKETEHLTMSETCFVAVAKEKLKNCYGLTS